MCNICSSLLFTANQKEIGTVSCRNCDGAFERMLEDNHKAITDAVFDNIYKERNKLKIKMDRMEVLTKRVSLFVDQQKSMRNSLQECLKNCNELKHINAKLTESLKSCANSSM